MIISLAKGGGNVIADNLKADTGKNSFFCSASPPGKSLVNCIFFSEAVWRLPVLDQEHGIA
jgi:hypothetical protein